jgi:hypothetical protein
MKREIAKASARKHERNVSVRRGSQNAILSQNANPAFLHLMFVMTRPHLGLIIQIRTVPDTIGVHFISGTTLQNRSSNQYEVLRASHTSGTRCPSLSTASIDLACSLSKITQLVSRPPRNFGTLASLADIFLPRRPP